MSDIIEQIPAFLRELLQKEYPLDCARILDGYACERPTSFRVNPLKGTREEAEQTLARLGLPFERTELYEDAYLVKSGGRELAKSALFTDGKIYMQSLSSMLPPLLLCPKAGEQILDMTAAPGGKTSQLFALSGGKALITACEKDRVRFERMKFNFARQGVRANAMLADAGKLSDFLRFDKILLDAPCSGSGTLSLGAPMKISPKLVENSVRIQRTLLKKALKMLKSGGTLVYSTCSVLKEENEETVFAALRGENARLAPIEAAFSARLPLLPSAENTLTVCPTALFEGFFLAKIVKERAESSL